MSSGWRDLLGRFVGWSHASRTCSKLRLSGNIKSRMSANVPSERPLPVGVGVVLLQQEIAMFSVQTAVCVGSSADVVLVVAWH